MIKKKTHTHTLKIAALPTTKKKKKKKEKKKKKDQFLTVLKKSVRN
jgi:hypothetical protein